MKKSVALIGSTGSIGLSALDVMENAGMTPIALAAGKNAAALEEQARKYNPKMVAMFDEDAAKELKIRLADTDILVDGGREGVCRAAAYPADIALIAAVGMEGLPPTLAAIDAGRNIALANKESLVCAGGLVTSRAKAQNVRILPVDSEHSAIFQCIEGRSGALKRVILTASGGPFFGFSAGDLQNVTPEQALKHPNWNMGRKITIDSATMMNKGLEVLEAIWLYSLAPSQVEVVVHRESIVHSLVEFKDLSVLAQLSPPDMRLPIQYALTYPEVLHGITKPLDLIKAGKLTFYPPDNAVFPALSLAYRAAEMGKNAGAIYNGANEAAVELFLSGKISFPEIATRVAAALESVPAFSADSTEAVYESDRLARINVALK